MRTAALRVGLIGLASLVLAACASGPEVRVDADPSVRITDYRSFGFFDPLATDKAGYSTLVTSRLKEATRRELESRGYRYDAVNPELLVNFQLNVEDRSEIRSTPSAGGYYGGYYGYRSYGAWAGYPADIQTINYKQGTLNIDVVDAGRKALVWQSFAEGRIKKKSMENPGPAIDQTVTLLLADFPSLRPPTPPAGN
ncbi:MAG: DUF4136 domain-containing protein [Gammaproteobacteria bacterium]|jgi:hypothetical protein|nr:DUF4136 domain-containing protein [Gammaproteobacteria bacterium]